MNTDKTLSLAREAGIERYAKSDYCKGPYWAATDAEMCRFAQLVRDDYRAELLAGSGEPVAWMVETEARVMVWPASDYDEALTYCEAGEAPEPLYAHDDTALLRQARQLCELIGKTPHQRGSINGLAAQLGHALRERLAAHTPPADQFVDVSKTNGEP